MLISNLLMLHLLRFVCRERQRALALLAEPDIHGTGSLAPGRFRSLAFAAEGDTKTATAPTVAPPFSERRACAAASRSSGGSSSIKRCSSSLVVWGVSWWLA